MANKSSTAEENVALMRKFVKEVQQGGNMSMIDELIHPQFYNHTSDLPQPEGPAGGHKVMKAIHAGLSEIRVDIIQSIGDGNVVATNKVLSGKHTGDFFGKPGTGERVKMGIMDFVTIEDGMIKEHWARLGPVEVVKE